VRIGVEGTGRLGCIYVGAGVLGTHVPANVEGREGSGEFTDDVVGFAHQRFERWQVNRMSQCSGPLLHASLSTELVVGCFLSPVAVAQLSGICGGLVRRVCGRNGRYLQACQPT